MNCERLLNIASFNPLELNFPNAWIGHLPFAAWIIQETTPALFVELGTHTGNSYFSFCQAVVEFNLKTICFAVDTWEGDTHAGKYGEEVFSKVATYNALHFGRFSQLLRMTFDRALDYFSDGSIELLHIDGLHTYEAVKHDFETWLPKLAPGAVILFHDTCERDDEFGVWKLWEELQSYYSYNIEFIHSHGLGVLQLPGCTEEKKLKWMNHSFLMQKIIKKYFSALGTRQIERYDHILAKKNIVNLNKIINERDKIINERDEQIFIINKELDNFKMEVSELKNNINNIEIILKEINDSTSWKVTAPLRLFGSHYKRIKGSFGKFARLIYRFGGMMPLCIRIVYVWRNNGIKKIIRKLFSLTKNDDMALTVSTFSDKKNKEKARFIQLTGDPSFEPKISIITPLYNTKDKHLIEMLESVLNQTYNNWELCIADGSDQYNLQRIGNIIKDYLTKDCRIKYKPLSNNGGIASNTIEAYNISSGDYVLLLDHDDLLDREALLEVRNAIEQNRDVDFIYSDRSIFSDETGEILAFHYLPGFSPDYLRSCNYASHLNAFSRSIIQKVGFEQLGYDGSQDYEFELRVIEKTTKIVNVPKVLYHCRACAGSVALCPENKMYAYEAGKRAIEEHIYRIGYPGKVEFIKDTFSYRIYYNIGEPNISIIIPNMDHVEDLSRCISSIMTKTTYSNYEIIIIENNSKDIEIFKYYDEISKNEKIHILHYNRNEPSFNFSAINNWAILQSQSDYVVLLNNDTEIITSDWLEQMLMFCQRSDVGAVGAKLYYKNDTNQHTGLIIGLGGHIASSYGHGKNRFETGYMHKLSMPQNFNAVTAACMMVKKSDYVSVNGLDEHIFKIGLNDIDFCLKLVELGKLNVVTPYAELYHFESSTRGSDAYGSGLERYQFESKAFRLKWNKYFESRDKYDNVNFIELYN